MKYIFFRLFRPYIFLLFQTVLCERAFSWRIKTIGSSSSKVHFLAGTCCSVPRNLKSTISGSKICLKHSLLLLLLLFCTGISYSFHLPIKSVCIEFVPPFSSTSLLLRIEKTTNNFLANYCKEEALCYFLLFL